MKPLGSEPYAPATRSSVWESSAPGPRAQRGDGPRRPRGGGRHLPPPAASISAPSSLPSRGEALVPKATLRFSATVTGPLRKCPRWACRARGLRASGRRGPHAVPRKGREGPVSAGGCPPCTVCEARPCMLRACGLTRSSRPTATWGAGVPEYRSSNSTAGEPLPLLRCRPGDQGTEG